MNKSKKNSFILGISIFLLLAISSMAEVVVAAENDGAECENISTPACPAESASEAIRHYVVAANVELGKVQLLNVQHVYCSETPQGVSENIVALQNSETGEIAAVRVDVQALLTKEGQQCSISNFRLTRFLQPKTQK